MNCAFCEISHGRAAATWVRQWSDAIAIVPLNPVTSGHVLVIPRQHVTDALDDPEVTALTMRRAAEIAPYPSNIITSAGSVATQTIFHLHLHIVPRTMCDGLMLPWSAEKGVA